MASFLYSPISSRNEPLDLVLVKSSDQNHHFITIGNLFLHKQISLTQLNLALVHSIQPFEVKIKPNSEDILELLRKTFTMGGLSSHGLSQSALLLGSFSDDQLLFVVYGHLDEQSRKMQLRALQLCVFDQPIVGLLWQHSQGECEDPTLREALHAYFSQLEQSSLEGRLHIDLPKPAKQSEQCIRLSQPPLSASSFSSSQISLPNSSQGELARTSPNSVDHLRRNRDLIKYAIKRLLQKHGIHSKHPEYLAMHKLIYESCKFRLRKELSLNSKIEKNKILETVQSEYQRNLALVVET